LNLRQTAALGALALLLASPLVLADATQAPVRGGAHADYEADAGAILAQALAADPAFRFDLTFERATVYELRLPRGDDLASTRGALLAVPESPKVLSMARLGRDALRLDAAHAASVLLASDPRGVTIAGLPALTPGEPARFLVDAAAPVATVLGAAQRTSLHELEPGGAVHYTVEGLRFDALRAHAEGGLVTLITRGLLVAADGTTTELGPVRDGTRAVLVFAEDAVADVAAEGLDAVLTLPAASLGAGGQLVADVAGRHVGAGHDANLASGNSGLDIDSAYGLQAAVLGNGFASPSGSGASSAGAGVVPIEPQAVAAGAVVGSILALAAAGVAGIAAAGKYGLFAVLAPLYARLQHDEVLQNRTREAIYRYVVEHPGINVSEVVKHFGLGWGATVYHLRVLERNHLVVPSKQGRQVCYFQNGGTWSTGQRAGISALRNPNAAHVARVVLAKAGVQQRELCKLTGLAQPTVSWHLARLEEAGLVAGDGAPRRRYSALPALQDLAQRGLVPLPEAAVPAAPPAATPA
jgi:predicted transcriptional regulator